MLAVSYDLDPSGSFWTSAAAAELFWAIFVIALGIAAFVIALRPRRRKRTWTYDEPPHVERRRPARDDYRVSATGSAAKTRSTISPDSPR